MNRLLRGIKRRTIEMLSLDRMSEKYQVLAVNYIFLMLYSTLESVFVNTLLYRISSDISIVIFYRGMVFVVTAVAMQFAAYMGQKKTPLATIRLGSVLYFLSYLALFLFLDYMAQIMYLAATLTGLGAAFYWSGHNLLVTHYTTKDNRDIAISILGIIQGVMTLCVPVVSGFVIAWMPGTTGYRVMFGIGMLSVGAQLYFQKFLAHVEQKKHTSEIRLALKLLTRKVSYRLMMGYEFIRGFRDGAFAFILNMLLFEIITDESLVGINTFLTGVMAIIGSWVYGKFVTPRMRARYSVIATIILVVSCGSLLLLMNAATVITFSIINAFFILFIVYSCNNFTYDVISQNETTRKCMGEVLAIREGSIALGRVCGLIVVMLFPRTQLGYIQAMLLLTVAQALAALFQKLTEKVLIRNRARDQVQLAVEE